MKLARAIRAALPSDVKLLRLLLVCCIDCVLEHQSALRKGGMKEEEGVADFAGAPFANLW